MVEPDIDTDPDGYKDVAEALVNGTADKVEDVVYPHVPLHPVGTFTVGCAAIPTFNPIDIIVAPGAHTHYHSFWGSEIAATGRDHGFLLTSDHKNSPGR